MGIGAVLWILFLIGCSFTIIYEYFAPKIEKKKWEEKKFTKDNIEMNSEKNEIVNTKQEKHNILAKENEIKRREKLLNDLLNKLVYDKNKETENNRKLGKRLIDDNNDDDDNINTNISETERIIKEQDIEYYKSLETDQLLKLLKERDNNDKKEAQEKLKKERQERIEYLKLNLKSEPSTDDENSIKLLIKLPNGINLQRRFLKSDILNDIYDFIDSKDQVSFNYSLSTNYPKKVYENTDNIKLKSSFEELNITNLTTFYLIEN
ncbi:hypothetical protein RB653_006958 [Dictyostelium firmibasis]|uniref:UBX domain-containing protein n=1 Tax=Dictyostelium firmibasis TaxID=79012 RepID=A0AAN7YLN0_9MYCE